MCDTFVCHSFILYLQPKRVLEDFLAFVILFNYVIPISLYVTVGKWICIGSHLALKISEKALFC